MLPRRVLKVKSWDVNDALWLTRLLRMSWVCKTWRRRDYWLWDATTGEPGPPFSLVLTMFPFSVKHSAAVSMLAQFFVH